MPESEWPRRRPARLDLILLAIAAIAIAFSAPLAKAAQGITPTAIAAGRTVVAAVAILLLAPRRTLRSLRDLSWRTRWQVIGVGCVLAVHFALFLGGVANTSLPAAVALVSLEPLAVVLVAWILFGVRPSLGEGIGVLLATVGAYVVSFGIGQGEHRLSGDLMVLGASLVYGLYVACARGLRSAMPSLPYAASVYGVCFVVLLPFAWSSMGQAPPPPVSSVWIVIAMGLIPTLIGHTAIQRAARHLPPSLVALVSPGETVGSLAIGAIWLRAWPSPYEWAGAGLITLGSLVAILAQRSHSPS